MMGYKTLYLDFETRSEAEIGNVGSHRYCLDNTTQVVLLSCAFDDNEVSVFREGEIPDFILDAMEDDTTIKVAHNAEFDMCCAKYILGLDINFETWHDTAFQAAYLSLPRKLSSLAEVLGTQAKASPEEMLMFATPKRKARLTAPELMFFTPQCTLWNEPEDHPEAWERFLMYAQGDVTVMRECHKKMIELPAIEKLTMIETFKMNFAGVPFDAEFASELYKLSQKYAQKAGDEAYNTYGIVNLRSTKQVQEALKEENIFLPSLNKKERGNVNHPILELRDQATGAAFSKVPTAFDRVCPDGKLRGEFVGNGAHTGRWSSRGVQLQNWARIKSEVSTDLSLVQSYDHLRQHMRLCLGHDAFRAFTCADLSQIEARIVAWLANCTWRLEAFKNGVDIYARSAEKMFNIEHVAKTDEARQYGKCAELGLGYGGGVQALANIQPDFVREIGVEKASEIVLQWRAANPEITRLWRASEQAYRGCMDSGRVVLDCGLTKLVFVYDGRNVRIELPSGRALYYRGVRLQQTERGSQIVFKDYSRGGNVVFTTLWGGTIVQNITQAIAKDVIIHIVGEIKNRGVDATFIGTVHDESWYLHPKSVPMLDIVLEEMAKPISWANGLITKGDGFTSDRYRK